MPPFRMATIIDLTSDDNDIPASETIDLTSIDEPKFPRRDSLEPKVKVEEQSQSALTRSSSTYSGDSSPKARHDDDTTLTESNHTDASELSPSNLGQQHHSASDDDLPLSSILARSRKRKHDSHDASISESKPADASIPITREALGSLIGPQPLKPGILEFWSVHKPPMKEPQSVRLQQNENTRAQQGRKATGNSNPHILNIDREEVFGREKKRPKHHSHPKSSQKESASRQSQLSGQISSKPVPSGEDFEGSGNKSRTSGLGKPSQLLEPTEIQRSLGRHKPSGRKATARTSSLAVGPNKIRSKAATADRHQGRRPEIQGIGRSSSSVDKATGIPGSSTKYRPHNLHRSRWERATAHGKSQKRHTAQAPKEPQNAVHTLPGRQHGRKKYPMAAQNEGRQWRQHLKSNASQELPCYRNEGPLEFHEVFNGHDSDAPASPPPSESHAGQIAPVRPNEGIHETHEAPDIDLEKSQQMSSDRIQQESDSIQQKLSTTHLADRLKQLQPKRSLNTQDNDLEEARAFFQDRYSQAAQKRKTILTDSVPADLGKPSYTARRQMVRRNTGMGFGPKRQTAIKNNEEKRASYRRKAIESKRQALREQMDHEFAYESKEDRERRVEAGVAELRRKFEKNDQKRDAQKSHGLLTVDFLEDSGGFACDPTSRPPPAAPKGKRHGMPVSEALEPGATILLYAVYISDPVDKGKDFDDGDMKRLADQFLKKEEANKHAEEVLRKDSLHDSQLVSIQFRVGPEDGLFFGIKELSDGKTVMCMVQSERHMSSELNLRDIFVNKELKEIYRPRFDVFYTTVIPKVFLEKKKASTDEDKDNSTKAKSPASVAREEPEPEEDEDHGDNSSLFSAPSTPEPRAAQDKRDKEEEEDEEEDSDADSVATDVTLSPSQPGGNLGSLTWNDVEYLHEHVDGFTTLELANEEAVKVARELWRPRGSRMDPWLYYRNSIEPSLREVKTKDLDLEAATLEFAVPDFEGHVDERPWPFIYSRVFVKETRLEGPRDIGNHVVMDNGGESDGDGGEN
ncbi:hypothetical protein diail_11946 [Diaporthe ilicicola]|nr:hypothetical protein diail_11946 [Diaporthe ilicicola]